MKRFLCVLLCTCTSSLVMATNPEKEAKLKKGAIIYSFSEVAWTSGNGGWSTVEGFERNWSLSRDECLAKIEKQAQPSPVPVASSSPTPTASPAPSPSGSPAPTP